MNLSDLLSAAAQVAVVASGGTGALALVAVKHKQKLDILRQLANTYVRAVEQQCGKTLSNPEKKAKVVASIRKKLPWLPTELIDAAVEAAVNQLPRPADPLIHVNVPPSPAPVVHVTTTAAAPATDRADNDLTPVVKTGSPPAPQRTPRF